MTGKLIVFISLAIVGFINSSVQAEVRVEPQDIQYPKLLDSYLTQEVKQDDVVPNLEAAQTYLDELKAEGKANDPLIGTTKRFVALSGLNRDNLCDLESYNIIKDNDTLIGGAGRTDLFSNNQMNSSNRPLGRLSKIINYYGVSFGRKCQKNIYRTHGTQFWQLTHGDRETVKSFIDPIMGSLSKPDSGRDGEIYHYFILDKTKPIYEYEEGLKSLFKRIQKSGDIDVEYLLDPVNSNSKTRTAKVRGMFNRQLVAPCEKFVNAAKKLRIFEMMEFSLVLYQQPLSKPNNSFYIDWARYNLCEILIADKDLLVRKLAGSPMVEVE